jgi:hypothetical protein
MTIYGLNIAGQIAGQSKIYPRLPHLAQHIGGFDTRREACYQILPLLLEPLDQQEIADRLGVTRRKVEYYWESMRTDFGIVGTPGHSEAPRLTLLRMALGLDACFCGDAPAIVKPIPPSPSLRRVA